MNDPEESEHSPAGTTRREFIAQVTAAGVGLSVAPLLQSREEDGNGNIEYSIGELVALSFTLNGVKRNLHVDARSA